MSTDLYERTIAYDKGDQRGNDLMRKVWESTPWMVDAFTSSCCEARYQEMTGWCRDNYGQDCWPIHGRPGTWQTGGATVFGWTWFGFATEAQLNKFMAAWPNPTSEGE